MKNMLAYQEVDLKIKRLEEQISNNEDRLSALKLQQFLKDCQAKLVEIGKKSEKIAATFEELKKVYNNCATNMEKLNKKANSSDEKVLENLIEVNDALAGNLSKLDKEFAQIVKQSDALSGEYNEIMKKARSARANMEKFKTTFAKFKEGKDAEIAALKAELEKLKGGVDAKLMEVYNAKRSEKMPVFVKLANGCCSGCRTELSASKQKELSANGHTVCETCGRIIFN